MRIFFVVSFFALCLNIVGQNLVPNPSFEDFTTCPGFASQIDRAAPWMNPQAGTPEFYHGCASWSSYVSVPTNMTGAFQNARTGVGYAGIYVFRTAIPNMREYIEVPLTAPLIAGECYRFEMFVNQPNDFELTSNGIGVYFSNGQFQPATNGGLAGVPAHIEHPSQTLLNDSTGWTPISGIYTASGGEDHITIGNFKNDANTNWAMFNPGVWYAGASYYLIDDVSVENITPMVDLGPDTTICEGQQLLIDAAYPGATYLWNNGSTGPAITVGQSGIYIVEVTNGNCTVQDTIEVMAIGLPMVDLGPDRNICAGDSIGLALQVDTLLNILWNDGSTNSTLHIDAAGTYWVQLSNACGLAVDSVSINSGFCSEQIFVPNAFTPNGDGINDFFFPVYDPAVQQITVELFDRWGMLVHVVNTAPWNGQLSGRPAPEGVYVWKATSSLGGKQSGHLTLLR